MSQEIFGDKPPHQVSVSEGSGNAGSSRSRSGKFKADSTRRISVNADEGELVSRQIQTDQATGLQPEMDAPGPGATTDAGAHRQAAPVRTVAPAAGTGPRIDAEKVSDHKVKIDAAHGDENRVSLPATDPAQANVAHLDEGGLADNVVPLPPTDALGDNRALLPDEAVSERRINLPSQAAAPQDQPIITPAEVAPQNSPNPESANYSPKKMPSEPSAVPRSTPTPKSQPLSGDSPSVQSSGSGVHRETLPAEGTGDHRVALPADGSDQSPNQKLSKLAGQDHREPVPDALRGTHVQQIHTDTEALRTPEFGPHDQDSGGELQAETEEISALAHTHIEDSPALTPVKMNTENRPPPQAVKLQADLWREGFRGRVAQIKAQVASIHENLDKLEQ
ncbi:MAG: hypothetical protein EBT70_02995 [Betaproteobacteria bacterium]|nr:hypothetical protein [Betaproteobacteria bacterium]